MRIKIGGGVRTVHSTAIMAKKINKSTSTIRRWERAEIIPAAVFRDDLGRRYYLTEEIEVLADLIIEFGMETSGKAPKKEFTKRVIEEWSRCRGKRARTIDKTGSRKTNGIVELW